MEKEAKHACMHACMRQAGGQTGRHTGRHRGGKAGEGIEAYRQIGESPPQPQPRSRAPRREVGTT